ETTNACYHRPGALICAGVDSCASHDLDASPQACAINIASNCPNIHHDACDDDMGTRMMLAGREAAWRCHGQSTCHHQSKYALKRSTAGASRTAGNRGSELVHVLPL